ncbi:hypothetical protein [Hydrogenivirga sp.]
MRVIGLIFTVVTLLGSVAVAKDPFMNKENAVGYIVIDNHGLPERYIVVESKEGGVKLIRTEYEPEEVLRQGGKKK